MLTVIGIFFVFYEGFTQTSVSGNVLQGDFLLFFAVLTFSSYLSFGKGIIDKYGALKVQSFVFLLGSILYIPIFIYDFPNLTFANLTAKGIIGYFFLTFIVAYLAYFAWYYAIKSIALSKLTTLSNVAPLLTVLFSIIFLSEPISTYFILGGAITICGVFIMHRKSIELS
jgi:drug/metabolite transporter (DMT)-like permease